jgi:hypothetical protein
MKRTMKITALLLVTSASQAADIASGSWGANRQKELNAAQDLRVQAQHLLETVLPDADLVAPNVGEAYFVDLDKDANLELVATVDYSGRGFFNNVVVVWQQQDKFVWSETRNNGRSIENLSSHLIDANGDGRPELVLERFMDRYEGAQRVPTETIVYRWQTQGFKDDSDAFPQYYRTNIVPDLEKKLAKASAKPSSSPSNNDDEVFTLTGELAKAKRRGRMD